MRIFISIATLVWLAACGNSRLPLTEPPVAKGSQEPALIATDKGLILSWMEPQDGDILLRMAVYDKGWSGPQTIARGYDWFVNWADFPAITANGEKLFAYFLKKTSQDHLAYDIMYTVSPDFGQTWSKPQRLHQDTTATEHGFVSAVPYKDGFYVSWLDGRNTRGMSGNFALMGVAVGSDGTPGEEVVIDDNTCTCCQTSMALVNGVPWVFYRNRTEEEIRDIYYSSLTDSSWRVPQSLNADNWHIAGCPVNGPRAVAADDHLAVAWFTGADHENKVKLKISADSGQTFGEEIFVEEDSPIGRVDVQMDTARVYVTYLKNAGSTANLILKTYDFAGSLLNTQIIAGMRAGRATGFPRFAIREGILVFTWTDVETLSVKITGYPVDGNSIIARARM